MNEKQTGKSVDTNYEDADVLMNYYQCWTGNLEVFYQAKD